MTRKFRIWDLGFGKSCAIGAFRPTPLPTNRSRGSVEDGFETRPFGAVSNLGQKDFHGADPGALETVDVLQSAQASLAKEDQGKGIPILAPLAGSEPAHLDELQIVTFLTLHELENLVECRGKNFRWNRGQIEHVINLSGAADQRGSSFSLHPAEALKKPSFFTAELFFSQ